MRGEVGSPVGRRMFLSLIGLGGAGIVLGSGVQSSLERLLRPLVLADRTGLTSLLPTAGRFRIYSVVGFLPERTPAEYRLTVDGLVARSLTLGLDELLAMPATEIVRDFQCVTGWRVEDVRWKGVRLSTLLDAAGVADTATHVRFHSFDGVYTETLTLDQAGLDDVLVAYEMLDGPVTREHGGPVRLYVAPMYGYKSIKWLDRITVESVLPPDPLQPGYWEVRGYDTDAWIGDSNGRDDDPV